MKSQIHASKTSKRVIAYFFVLAIAFAGTAPAFAQTTDFATKDADEWKQLSLQLVESLDSPIAQVKQGTLQHINFFATYHKEDVDLSVAVPKLIDIYETDDNEGSRILALTALNAIGDRSIMIYLSETVNSEPSPRVRALTLAALADYIAREDAL